MINRTILSPEMVEIPTPPTSPKAKFSTILLPIILSLVFVALLFAAYYYGVYQNKITSPTAISTATPTAIPTAITPVENSDDFGTLTWNASPKKITDPSVLNSTTTPNTSPYGFTDLGTYEVGKFSKGAALLVTFVVPEGPSSPLIFRLISDKGKYYLVESLINDDYIKKELDQIFDITKVKFISYQIKELFSDSYYSSGNMSFSLQKNVFNPPQVISSIKNYKLVATFPIGKMLSVDTPLYGNTDLVSRNYFLELRDFTLVAYSYSSAISSSDNRVPYFTYLDNSPNKSSFNPLKSGCGGGYDTTVIVNQSILNPKTLIGKNGDTNVYQIKSVDSSLVKYLYDQYKLLIDPSKTLSIDKFAEAVNHIIFQEKTGDWTLLVNADYSLQAECGKPVIYLYPIKDTQASVKVGADITKSEPLYPANGWTVLAHPNGQLDYQGQIYSNLFWEGRGHGLYPNLGNYGVVVTQNKLISTLKSQLTQLGLNTQESADFMEFWTEKLPTTPYIRLTWLDTVDLNQLAPLSVNPKPDTVIRIFLDFAGLDKPIKLIPQKLSAPPRLGFTLVEWGGLLVK